MVDSPDVRVVLDALTAVRQRFDRLAGDAYSLGVPNGREMAEPQRVEGRNGGTLVRHPEGSNGPFTTSAISPASSKVRKAPAIFARSSPRSASPAGFSWGLLVRNA